MCPTAIGNYRRLDDMSLDVGVQTARDLFLKHAAKLKPDMLSALRKDVYPAYQACYTYPNASRLARMRIHPAIFSGMNAPHGKNKTRLTHLQSCLGDWLAAFLLETNNGKVRWIRRFVLTTLWWWQNQQNKNEPALDEWCPLTIDREKPTDLDISFQDAGWDPQTETRQEAQKRLSQAFQTYFRNYAEKVETEYREDGRFYKGKTRRELKAHVEWLAEYQVGEMSFAAIGFEARRRPQTIIEGVQNAAKLIGITLRKSPRGRPKKVRSR